MKIIHILLIGKNNKVKYGKNIKYYKNKGWSVK